MENKYAAVVAERTSEELLQLLQEREQYEPEVVLAVVDELERRGVAGPELMEMRQEAERLQQAQRELAQQPGTTAEKLQDFGKLFVPQPGYFITPILLDLNLLAFGLMLLLGINFMDPDAASLIAIGGNFGPYTLSGEWWRLLTCVFLHAGIIHLAFNMLALVSVGRVLEPLVGKWPFLIAYLLCGLAGSITSLWWDSMRAGVGASGAIFGMFGMLLVIMLLEQKLHWQQKKGMLLNLGFVLVLNLAFGMKSGIDNAAHSGGLVCGLLFGTVLLLRSNRQITQQYSAKGNAVMAGVGLLLLLVFYQSVPFTGQARLAYTLDQVGNKEAQAMHVLQALVEEGEKAKAADFVPLLEQGVSQLNESIILLQGIDDATGADKDRITVMLQYLLLRKQSFELLRDNLQQHRPWQNPRQEQLLRTINQYVSNLQKGEPQEK
ncbi:rhomboid family intramembrane serine protease [Pontibacter chitinilyticus]|uniref:rhomboid family intramembrane serine protease n=1 Tax=Pontibacter chitinilyticus TaxID=2674989 RepID=UPI00321A9DCA